MAVCLALSWQAPRRHGQTISRPNASIGRRMPVESEAALGESVAALQKLYAQSGDAKVRADLICAVGAAGARGSGVGRVQPLCAGRLPAPMNWKIWPKPRATNISLCAL